MSRWVSARIVREMAAVDTATAGGTRRAVVRSERFMQWHRDLSSNRAAYGACREYSNEKSDAVRTNQRKSEDMGGRARTRGLEAKQREGPDYHNDTLKVRARRQQSQKPEQSLDCQRLDITDHQCRTRDAHTKQEVCQRSLQQGKASPQPHQPKQTPQQSITRRRRRRALMETQFQPSRSLGCETNGTCNLPAGSRGSKRSSRLLARKLGIEKPAPAPLKLPKLQVVLSRKEFQEDWHMMTGQRYVGKPKKSAIAQLGLGLCNSLTCPSTIRYLNDILSERLLCRC